MFSFFLRHSISLLYLYRIEVVSVEVPHLTSPFVNALKNVAEEMVMLYDYRKKA